MRTGKKFIVPVLSLFLAYSLNAQTEIVGEFGKDIGKEIVKEAAVEGAKEVATQVAVHAAGAVAEKAAEIVEGAVAKPVHDAAAATLAKAQFRESIANAINNLKESETIAITALESKDWQTWIRSGAGLIDLWSTKGTAIMDYYYSIDGLYNNYRSLLGMLDSFSSDAQGSNMNFNRLVNYYNYGSMLYNSISDNLELWKDLIFTNKSTLDEADRIELLNKKQMELDKTNRQLMELQRSLAQEQLASLKGQAYVKSAIWEPDNMLAGLKDGNTKWTPEYLKSGGMPSVSDVVGTLNQQAKETEKTEQEVKNELNDATRKTIGIVRWIIGILALLFIGKACSRMLREDHGSKDALLKVFVWVIVLTGILELLLSFVQDL